MLGFAPLFETVGCVLTPPSSSPSAQALTAERVLPKLARHGAVLMRGFSLDLTSFAQVSDRCSSAFLTHLAPSLRRSFNDDKTIAGVLEGNGAVLLHGEMYYMPLRPRHLWLYCSVPCAEGGETTLLDAPTFLAALTPATRALFDKKRVRYRYRMKREQWSTAFSTPRLDDAVAALRSRQIDTIEVLNTDTLQYQFVTSAIAEGPDGRRGFINSIANLSQYGEQSIIDFEDGQPIGPEVLEEITRCGERKAQRLRWQANDLLLVDNTWVLHGRRAFAGPRVIATRFGLHPVQINVKGTPDAIGT